MLQLTAFHNAAQSHPIYDVTGFQACFDLPQGAPMTRPLLVSICILSKVATHKLSFQKKVGTALLHAAKAARTCKELKRQHALVELKLLQSLGHSGFHRCDVHQCQATECGAICQTCEQNRRHSFSSPSQNQAAISPDCSNKCGMSKPRSRLL